MTMLALSSEAAGLLGGVLIGVGSLLAFAVTHKVPGISGVFGRLFRPKEGDYQWRLVMLAGLVLGAGLAFWLIPAAQQYQPAPGRTVPVLILAGFLVGFGTRLGGGCTSGHGVCGMSRGVRDSIAATIIFIVTGMITVWAWNQFAIGGAA